MSGPNPNGTPPPVVLAPTRTTVVSIAGRPVDLVSASTFPWTDSGNAERVVAFAGADLRYVTKWKKWMFWTGRRWALDDGAPHRAAKAVARAMMRQANRIGDADRRTAAIKYALKCESKASIDAAVGLARHDLALAITHTDLDADPWAFNCRNGTIDLKTGKLREHRREDLITKIAPVDFDPEAKCERFERFVSEIMAGDGDLVLFMHRHLGYGMSGDVRDHVLAFWFGAGGNGKSLLSVVVLAVLGDYGGKTAPDLLFRSEHTDRHPTELADLHGRRLVVCNETRHGRTLDEGTLKDVTGDDPITARRMKEDFWTFSPSHKIVLFGNQRPRIKCLDKGIERRLRLVPFAVSFVGREDKNLKAALLAELPGVLAWLVRGCVAWQAEGLPEARAIIDATAAYIKAEDTLGQFFEDECVLKDKAGAQVADKVTRKQVRDRYLEWSEARGEKPVSGKDLADAIRDRGAVDRKVRADGKSCAGWVGIRLVTDKETAEKEAKDEARGDVATCGEPNQGCSVQEIPRGITREPDTTGDHVTTEPGGGSSPPLDDALWDEDEWAGDGPEVLP